MDRLSKEIIKIKTDSEKYAVNKTKELLKVYKRNLNDVKNQISKIYMKYILDGCKQSSKMYNNSPQSVQCELLQNRLSFF